MSCNKDLDLYKCSSSLVSIIILGTEVVRLWLVKEQIFSSKIAAIIFFWVLYICYLAGLEEDKTFNLLVLIQA